MTWLRRADGFELLFNRDELLSRADAEPPRRHVREGVAWLAPVDGESGGTWIAVNEHGLALAVLNGYRTADEADRDWTSRGLLVADLATGRNRSEIESRLAVLDPEPYRSFRLLVLAPDPPALVAEWDRRHLSLDPAAEARRLIISSSFEETDVGRARRAEYERVAGRAPALDRLIEYHRSTAGGPSAYSVSMEREEAATRSFTRVTVTATSITMRYAPGPPHRPGPETVAVLSRVPLSSTAPREESP